MADYRSTLTGTQMDAALLDMAEHNSEAYAVGERNGIAVASDDVTYHNNARYYAQIASSQIVGDASSAVRWDTDQSEVLTDAQKAQARENINAASDSDVVKITAQTLTSVQQAQARANIAAGGSNPNLLDNPWFGSGEVVNQRGNTSGTVSNTYFIDRWKLSGTYSIAASGITFTCNAGAGVSQIFPHALTIGETYTFSVMYGDGSIVSCTFAPLANRENAYPFGDGLYLEIDTRAAFPTHRCIIYTPGTSWTKEIKAVKLELGSVSTLANDAPPDYYKELDKCQWYFERIKAGNTYSDFGIGVALSTTAAAFLVNMHPKRNNQYTVVTSGVFGATPGGTINSLALDRAASNGVLNLYATGTFVANSPYVLRSANDANVYIDINNEL